MRMGLREDGPSVAVVGVTGAVGQEFLSVLNDRDFPYRSLRLLASKRSAGKQMTFEVGVNIAYWTIVGTKWGPYLSFY